MPTYGPTNTFATQAGNVPVAQLDQDFTDAFLGINNAYLVGTFATIPAPDGVGKGRYYFATDVQILYRDNGSAWVQVAASAIVANTFQVQNLFINGNWLIDQINEGALYTVTGGGADVQCMDGWSGAAAVAPGVFKVRRLADPDNANLTCAEITCTTIDAAIAAADAYYFYTAIEGYDVDALNIGLASASAITISFNFKSNVTGVYGVSVANSALNRSYVAIITVPDTSEHTYTTTLTMDTTGTWLKTNGVGLYFRIALAAGSNFQTTAGAWGANNMLTTSAQVNFMSNVANICYLKRIQLVAGQVAPSLGQQSYFTDLRRCQRYYWKSFEQGTAVAQSAGRPGVVAYRCIIAGVSAANSVHIIYPVQLRAAGTVTFYSPAAAATTWYNYDNGGGAASGASTFLATGGTISSSGGITIGNAQVAGDVVGDRLCVHVTSNARLS